MPLISTQQESVGFELMQFDVWFSSSLLKFTMCFDDECQTVRAVVVLPDRGDNNTQYEPPSSLSSLEVSELTTKGQRCLVSEPLLQSQTKLEVDKATKFAPSILDVDIEKGKAEIPKFNEESIANLKSDDFLTRALPRKICLQIGVKFMQLLMNHGTELPKFTSRDKLVAERVHDTLNNNRTRKFKRSASFNSRRVVLMFSVMSSIGTIILIYLTLRVRQISGNV